MNRLIIIHFLKLQSILIVLLIVIIKVVRRSEGRRWWIKPFNSVENRLVFGAYTTVFTFFQDHTEFYSFTRMRRDDFDYLLSLIEKKLKKSSSSPSINPELRLAAVLNFLGQGQSVDSSRWFWRLGRSTMYSMIPEVCTAIFEKLLPIYMPFPTEEDFSDIAKEYEAIWNMPNCIGSIDGKYIAIKKPNHSGSAFYNYKNFFSIVLMASCDANYRFTWANIGGYGGLNDSSLFKHSDLGKLLENKEVQLPESSELPGTHYKFPYFLIGDAGFPLKPYLMIPYSRCTNLTMGERIFNYRLSRARRMIESSFGIMERKFRILEGPMNFNVSTVEKIVLTLVCLQNFIITHEMTLPREDQNYIEEVKHLVFIDEEEIEDRTTPHNIAVAMRQALKTYFCSPAGFVPWHNDMI